MELPVEQEVEVQDIPDDLNFETFVSSDQALSIAKSFFTKQTGKSTLTTRAANVENNSTIEELKDNNKTSMYVVNFPDSGFVIIGASRSYFPILAYSEHSSFSFSSEEEMGGIAVWLEETNTAIRLSPYLNEQMKSNIQALWSDFNSVENYSYSNFGYTSASNPGYAGSFSSGPYFHMNWCLDSFQEGWYLNNSIPYSSNRENLYVHP